MRSDTNDAAKAHGTGNQACHTVNNQRSRDQTPVHGGLHGLPPSNHQPRLMGGALLGHIGRVPNALQKRRKEQNGARSMQRRGSQGQQLASIGARAILFSTACNLSLGRLRRGRGGGGGHDPRMDCCLKVAVLIGLHGGGGGGGLIRSGRQLLPQTKFPSGAFGAHGASGALGTHGLRRVAPLATACWPQAPLEGGGGWRPVTCGVPPPPVSASHQRVPLPSGLAYAHAPTHPSFP